MSAHGTVHADSSERADAGHASHPSYIKIWGILVVLLVVSVVGPMLGLLWVTLLTAFGIALVKALMVAAYFMHLNVEKRYIKYLLLILLALVVVFFAGVAPDVMKPSGQNWKHLPSVRPTPEAPAHR